MLYAVIEWYKDSGHERPAVVAGFREEPVKAAVVDTIKASLGDHIERDDGDWGTNFLDEFPYPDTTDAGAVDKWLDDLREWVSGAAWVTLYERGDPDLTEV